MNKALDTKTETEVVAYIARGDDYNTILKLLADRGITTTKGTLTHIKKRNAEALEYMQSAMQEATLSHAGTILRKSRQLLENKLDDAATANKDLAGVRELYDLGQLTLAEYLDQSERIIRRGLTATELNSITKESFNQSQVEQGKPSVITENPTQARANLQKVLNAIAAGDDEAAIKAIFLDA